MMIIGSIFSAASKGYTLLQGYLIFSGAANASAIAGMVTYNGAIELTNVLKVKNLIALSKYDSSEIYQHNKNQSISYINYVATIITTSHIDTWLPISDETRKVCIQSAIEHRNFDFLSAIILDPYMGRSCIEDEKFVCNTKNLDIILRKIAKLNQEGFTLSGFARNMRKLYLKHYANAVIRQHLITFCIQTDVLKYLQEPKYMLYERDLVVLFKRVLEESPIRLARVISFAPYIPVEIEPLFKSIFEPKLTDRFRNNSKSLDVLASLEQYHVNTLYSLIRRDIVTTEIWVGFIKHLLEEGTDQKFEKNSHPHLLHLTAAAPGSHDSFEVLLSKFGIHDIVEVPHYDSEDCHKMTPMMVAVTAGNWSLINKYCPPNKTEQIPPHPFWELDLSILNEEEPLKFNNSGLCRIFAMLLDTDIVTSGGQDVFEKVLSQISNRNRASIKLNDVLAFLSAHHWVRGLRNITDKAKREHFIDAVKNHAPSIKLDPEFDINSEVPTARPLYIAIQKLSKRSPNAIHYLLDAGANVTHGLEAAVARYYALHDELSLQRQTIKLAFDFLSKYDQRDINEEAIDASKPKHINRLWSATPRPIDATADAIGYMAYEKATPLLQGYFLVSFLTYVQSSISRKLQAEKKALSMTSPHIWKDREDQWISKGAIIIDSERYLVHNNKVPSKAKLAARDEVLAGQYSVRRHPDLQLTTGQVIPLKDNQRATMMMTVIKVTKNLFGASIYYLISDDRTQLKIICHGGLLQVRSTMCWSDFVPNKNEDYFNQINNVFISDLLECTRGSARIQSIEFAGYGSGGTVAQHLMVQLMGMIWMTHHRLKKKDYVSSTVIHDAEYKYPQKERESMKKNLDDFKITDMRRASALQKQLDASGLNLSLVTINTTGVTHDTNYLAQGLSLMLKPHVKISSTAAHINISIFKSVGNTCIFSNSHPDDVLNQYLVFSENHIPWAEKSAGQVAIGVEEAAGQIFSFSGIIEAGYDYYIEGTYLNMLKITVSIFEKFYPLIKGRSMQQDELMNSGRYNHFAYLTNKSHRDQIKKMIHVCNAWFYDPVSFFSRISSPYTQSARDDLLPYICPQLGQERNLDDTAQAWLRHQQGEDGKAKLPTLDWFTQHNRYDVLPGDKAKQTQPSQSLSERIYSIFF